MLAHCSLLVPFSAWAITHSRHHRNTNSLEDDEPFVPDFRSHTVARWWLGSLIESGAFAGAALLTMLVGGWPAYLTLDLGGPSKHSHAWFKDHFWPWSAHFEGKQVLAISASTAGVAGVLGLLGAAASKWGLLTVAAVYLVPLLIVNAHLVTITFLQHTHRGVPHYSEEAFSWLKGALATVDRSWGPLRDELFHHISNTHVVHHLFHEMPFYHAQEATAAVRQLLGPHYIKDFTPIGTALWREFRECKFVEELQGGDKGVFWFFSTQDALVGKPGVPLRPIEPLLPCKGAAAARR
jgi:omega-6 fatty acid desaturase (delta-12 desaturase)